MNQGFFQIPLATYSMETTMDGFIPMSGVMEMDEGETKMTRTYAVSPVLDVRLEKKGEKLHPNVDFSGYVERGKNCAHYADFRWQLGPNLLNNSKIISAS